MSGDRPDLCHAVRGLASSMRSPRTGDWLRLKIFGEAALHEESIQGAVGRGLQGQWTEGR